MSFDAFKKQQFADMVDGTGKQLYNNIYWNDIGGIVKNYNMEGHRIQDINGAQVTEEQLSNIYKWMLSQEK